MKNTTYLSTGENEHPTPDYLFNGIKNLLNIEDYNFDLCATKDNAKCENFWSKEDDSLTKEWSSLINWCNPPYSKDLQPKFIKKAHESHLKYGNTFVFLIPMRPDTAIWHDYIWGKADVYIFKGRPKFYSDKSPTYPSAVVVFNNNKTKNIYTIDKECNIINNL